MFADRKSSLARWGSSSGSPRPVPMFPEGHAEVRFVCVIRRLVGRFDGLLEVVAEPQYSRRPDRSRSRRSVGRNQASNSKVAACWGPSTSNRFAIPKVAPNSTWSAIFPWSCICPASFRNSCIRAGVQRRSKPRRLRRGPSQSANGHSGSAADTMTWSLVRRARLGPEVTHPYGRGPRFEPRRGSCSCGVAKSCRRTTALLVVGSRRTPKMRFQKTPSTVFHRFGPWR